MSFRFRSSLETRYRHGANFETATLVDDAALGKIQFAEMTVRVGQLHHQRIFGFGPTPPDLSQMEFKTIGIVDADAMLCSGDRIDNGFAARRHIAGDAQFCPAAIDIDLEVDVGKDGLVNF